MYVGLLATNRLLIFLNSIYGGSNYWRGFEIDENIVFSDTIFPLTDRNCSFHLRVRSLITLNP